MQAIVEKMLTDFERGRLSRRHCRSGPRRRQRGIGSASSGDTVAERFGMRSTACSMRRSVAANISTGGAMANASSNKTPPAASNSATRARHSRQLARCTATTKLGPAARRPAAWRVSVSS